MQTVETKSGENTDRMDAKHRVRKALRLLDDDQRTILTLHYTEGFSVGEIAVILNCPPGTVKSRMYKARQELKRAMERSELRKD